MTTGEVPPVQLSTGDVNRGGNVYGNVGTVNNYGATALQVTVGKYYRATARLCGVHTMVDVKPTDSALADLPRTDQLYVQPDVWVAESDPASKRGKRAATDQPDGIELSVPKRVPLQDCLQSSDAKFQRIVLTATSGMGKTTAVNQQVLALANGAVTPWLVLRLPSLLGAGGKPQQRVQNALKSDVVSALDFQCNEADAAVIADEVISRLDAAPGVMLFDALDEVPVSERANVLDALRLFLADRNAAQGNHRVILTSRPYAYNGELANSGFSLLPLALFTPPQVEALIDQYFSRVVNQPEVGTAMKLQVEYARSLPAQQDYVALLQEPMLATYACMLARESASEKNAAPSTASPLPTTRFELFDGVVRLLLEKWEPARANAAATPMKPLFERAGGGASPLRAMLEYAAYGQYAELSDQGSVDIQPPPELTHERLVAIADSFMPSEMPVRAGEVVRWLTERTAFLPARSESPTKRYEQHKQLGSFLAAGGLHGHHKGDDRAYAEALVNELFRAPESLRQMVTMGLARIRKDRRKLTDAVTALVDATKAMPTETGAKPPSWAVVASFAIAFGDAVLSQAWGGSDGKKLNDALDPLRSRLLELIETQQLTAPARSSAADALGVLDDPRFNAQSPRLMRQRFHTNPADEPIAGFVRIPAGPFKMGHAEADDKKPRSVAIKSDFYIARTLTTVAQYQCFVDAGGYEMDDRIWGAQGLAWRSGKFNSEIENWPDLRPATLRLQPLEWSAQLAHPSRPVTGLCWFEARAYARWLDAQLAPLALSTAPEWAALREKGYGVRLPAESQWERAARASSLTASHDHRWPWSDDKAKAAQLANVRGSGIDHVSSVGVFPPNAIGLCDMAGNAWQWMDNLYANPADFSRIEQGQLLKTDKDATKCERPALRGGSWINLPENASCSSRYRYLPDNSSNNGGVRVVLSLAE